MTKRYSKVAVSLPPSVLAAADELAEAQDRSRSWIVAEAIREYVRMQAVTAAIPLDSSRRVQLQRDLGLTADERVRDAEDIAVVPRSFEGVAEEPRVFRTYDEFAAWRRAQESPYR